MRTAGARPVRGVRGRSESGVHSALSSGRRLAEAVAGPLLIAGTVLLVLRDFVFGALLTTQDVLRFFEPVYCYLGRSLAHGHVPSWNPFLMAGAPFAADPQSGWLYLPAMALFSILPCGRAIGAMIALQPILAGLGVYWFLRGEGASRIAGTVGGLSLAMAIAGSELAVSLPFSGTLAWTALLLAAAARAFRARAWAGRLGWSLLTALAWGQLAGAHFGGGLLMGTAVFAVYAGMRLVLDVREDRASLRPRLAVLGVMAGSMAAVNLAILLPRLAYLPDTSLYLGYGRLQVLGRKLAGLPVPRFRVGGAADPGWPMKLATSPGAHFGAAALVLAFGSLWSKRHRPLAMTFLGTAGLFYVASLRIVAVNVPGRLRSLRLVDAYLHRPEWFSFPVLLLLAVLAGFGVEAWRDTRSPRDRVLMVAPAILAWGLLPLVAGGIWSQLWILAVGAAAGAVVLLAAVREPAVLVLLPVILAGELAASPSIHSGPPPFGRTARLFTMLPRPTVHTAGLTRAGPIPSALRTTDPASGRYAQIGRVKRDERGLPASTNTKSNQMLLFEVQDVGTYNPVQLFRFWSFGRAANAQEIRYNEARFREPEPILLDLLQVGYVAAPGGRGVEPGSVMMASDGPWQLYRRPSPPPRAEVVGSWQVIPGPDAALKAVTAPGFDASRTVVLERDPALPGGTAIATGDATFRWLGPQAGAIDVQTSGPAMVLVRIPFHGGWRADVDGRRAHVLVADYVVQAIPVEAGAHRILLSYDDPLIGVGLLGSGLSIGVLVAFGALALAGARRRARPPPPDRFEPLPSNVSSGCG